MESSTGLIVLRSPAWTFRLLCICVTMTALRQTSTNLLSITILLCDKKHGKMEEHKDNSL